MMKMGTKTKKALEIEQAMADLGTSIAGSARREHSTMGFEVLKRNLGPALAVFADVVRNPVFPESELDREKKIRLDALSQEEAEPYAIAARVGPMLAFGHDHSYGRPVRGLPATVKGLTRDDFTRFHETLWKPGGSALVFAGDVTLEEATRLARQFSEPGPAALRNRSRSAMPGRSARERSMSWTGRTPPRPRWCKYCRESLGNRMITMRCGWLMRSGVGPRAPGST